MNIEELLAYSLDNNLNAAEQARLNHALVASEDLQELKDELFAMRTLLQGQLPERKADFTTAVLAQLPLRSSIGARVLHLFPRVAAACIAAMFITYIGIDLGTTDWVSDALVGTQFLSPEEAYTYLNDGEEWSEFSLSVKE